MAKGSRTIFQVLALILVIVGAGLVFWGFQLSDSIGSEVTEAVTGSEPAGVMIRYIAGAASLVAGIYLFFK